jgi:hypothetical protein
LRPFELKPAPRLRTAWLVSAAAHGAAVAVLVAIYWRTPARPAQFFAVGPVEPQMPVYGGSTVRASRRGGHGRPAPLVPPSAPTPAPAGVRDTTRVKQPAAVGPTFFIQPPTGGDPRIWVSPLPAIPADVADAAYGDQDARDSVAVRRLRAMIDTLNHIMVAAQQAGKPPSWTTEVAGKKLGIDQQFIYLMGIKIPTQVLALLGNSLPQGNYGEAMRAREIEYMRQDIMQAARRAENLEQFRRYVKDIRQRNQDARDFQRRQRGDTTRVKADTVIQ